MALMRNPYLHTLAVLRRTSARQWSTCALLLLVIATGTAMRVWQFTDRPLWEDEAYTWQDCQVPYLKLLWWKHDPVHGPLSHLCVRHTMQVFGSDAPWVMRLPSLVCGILVIPAGFWLGRVVHGNALGLVVAACVACDPNLVDQSQQARMYTMLALATTVALTQAIRLFENPPRERRGWIVLALMLTVQLAINFGAIALWLAIGVCGLGSLAWRNFRDSGDSRVGYLARGMATTFGLATLLSARGLWRLLHFMRSDRGVVGTSAHETWQALWSGFQQLTASGSFAVGAALAALLGMWLVWRQSRAAGLVLTVTAVLGTAMIYGSRSVHHMIAVRYFTVVAPALWVALAALPVTLLATGPRRPWRFIAGAASGVALAALLAAQSWQAVHIDQWVDLTTWRFVRTAAAQVRSDRRDEFVSCAPYINLSAVTRYYGLLRDEDIQKQRLLAEQSTSAIAAEPARVWLIASMWNPRSEIELRRWIEASGVCTTLGLDPEELVRLVKGQGLTLVHLGPRSFRCWVYDSATDRLLDVSADRLAKQGPASERLER